MRFHWMYGESDGYGKDYLYNFFDKLNEAGYYSVMFPYDPFINDWMIKVMPVTRQEHSLKYIFALRTYAISPEYTCMMFQQFNEYFPNRSMINVLAGDKFQMEKEKKIRGALFEEDFFENSEKRILYTQKWLDKFVNLPILKYKPEMLMTGVSNLTLDSVKKYADYSGCMIDAYRENPDRYNSVSDKRIGVAFCFVTENQKEYEDFEIKLKSSEKDLYERFTLYGNYDQIIQKIQELKNKVVKIEK